MPRLLSPAAVAALAGVSTVAVWKAIHAQRIKARAVYGPGGEPTAWAVSEIEAKRWVDSRLSLVPAGGTDTRPQRQG